MTTLTWHPSQKKRIRKHGYRSRSTTTAGKKILKSRRAKGRHSLAVTVHSK